MRYWCVGSCDRVMTRPSTQDRTVLTLHSEQTQRQVAYTTLYPDGGDPAWSSALKVWHLETLDDHKIVHVLCKGCDKGLPFQELTPTGIAIPKEE